MRHARSRSRILPVALLIPLASTGLSHAQTAGTAPPLPTNPAEMQNAFASGQLRLEGSNIVDRQGNILFSTAAAGQPVDSTGAAGSSSVSGVEGGIGESTRREVATSAVGTTAVDGTISAEAAGCSTVVEQRLRTASEKAQQQRVQTQSISNIETLRDFNCLDDLFDFRLGGFINIPSIRDIIDGAGRAACHVANDFVRDQVERRTTIFVPGVMLPGGVVVGNGSFGAGTGVHGDGRFTLPDDIELPGDDFTSGRLGETTFGVNEPPKVPTFLPQRRTTGPDDDGGE